MPNSYRIRTEIGKDKFLQVKLDQDYDKLELLSLAIFPNDVYLRDCAQFGSVCGRVFTNRGLGVPNARVSIFIPLQEEDENNPIISTLYPYKTFEQFNEDGYKYNLLPYTQSHSGHVPVGTFPDRIDVLTNQNVIQVYDKYYKFTAKTNSAGDYMIFGLPVGQHELFMQVDLSDIGEYSLTPQDLIRSGRATEAQIDGVKFKFSENYSELPQIVTLTKTIQIAPFYGQKEVCDYYITRADFDLSLEASVEIKPTAVFMGSIISTQDRKKINKNCKVPPKQGWLCDLTTGPGSIESVRQTVNLDSDNRPILESFLIDKDGKVIDENGAWMVELPMNLEYVYTDELGNKAISPDGSKGIPTKGKYRFKIKWGQSTFLSDENKRAYFLAPNIKEWGWTSSGEDPTIANTTISTQTVNAETDTNFVEPNFSGDYSVLESVSNIESFNVFVSYDDGQTWIQKDEYKSVIPAIDFTTEIIKIEYVLSDTNVTGTIKYRLYDVESYKLLSSYAFSLSWLEYGTPQMINEAVNCQDRFYEFEYNKVYTISQLIDRFTSKGIKLYNPQRTIQIKNITDNKCEGNYNRFPTNDAYYRYDAIFIILNAILTFLKFILIPLTIAIHVLALIYPVIRTIIFFLKILIGFIVNTICFIINIIIDGINIFLSDSSDIDKIDCPGWDFQLDKDNPFKNIKLPLILHSEDGCQACKCNVGDIDLEDDNPMLAVLSIYMDQYNIRNLSNLADFTTKERYVLNNSGYTNIMANGMGTWYSNNEAVKKTVTYNYNGNTDYPIDYANLSNNNNYKTWFRGPDDLSPFAAGTANSDSQFIKFNRLPVFPTFGTKVTLEDDTGYGYAKGWSSQLTIAERINLFNTKAKYFDGLSGTFSPGNVGWNQVKVRFFSDVNLNSSQNKNHYDNIVTLVLDSVSGIAQGDLIVFQNPRESTDPNVKTATGKLITPNYLTVNYADPNYGVGNVDVDYKTSNTTTTAELQVSLVGFDGQIITTTSQPSVKTCFPADLEYFQVIKVEKLSKYKEKRCPLNPTGNNRFSLAWRFLDSSYMEPCGTEDHQLFPAKDGGGNYTPSNFQNPSDYYNNSMMFMRVFQGNYSNATTLHDWTDGLAGCIEGINYPIINGQGPETPRDRFNTLGPLKSTYWNVWEHFTAGTQAAVVFLVRGVDPHSGKFVCTYDLSRLYGYENYQTDEDFNAAEINTTTDEIAFFGDRPSGNNSFLVKGKFFLNIPIQGEDDSFTNGLKLPRHTDFADNYPTSESAGGKIFFKSYLFTYDTNSLTENQVAYNGSWTTTQHLFYSSLDARVRDYGWTMNVNWGFDFDKTMTHWSATGADGPLRTDSNNNFFGKSWYRRVPQRLNGSFSARVRNCDTQGNLNNNSYACGAESAQPLNITAFGNVKSNFFGCGISHCSYPSYNYNGVHPLCKSHNEGDCESYEDPSGCKNWNTAGGAFFNLPTFNPYVSYNIDILDSGYPSGLPPIFTDDSANGTEPYASMPWEGGLWGSCRLFYEGGYESNSELGGKNAAQRYSMVFHTHINNDVINHVGGYYGDEYIEGGSVMLMVLDYNGLQQAAAAPVGIAQTWGYYGGWYDAGAKKYGYYNGGWQEGLNPGSTVFNRQLYHPTRVHAYRASGDMTAWCPNNRMYSINYGSTMYLSPVYANMIVANGNTGAGGNNCLFCLGNTGQNEQITMSSSLGIVFRTDRLPSSKRPNGSPGDNGTGYLLAQNPGFTAYIYTDTDRCKTTTFGGGNSAITPVTSEIEPFTDNLFQEPDVIKSTYDCSKAVDLNSYSIDNNQPLILPKSPGGAFGKFSEDGKWKWFERGEGCYNLVSRPIRSLLPSGEYDDYLNVTKKYSDIITVVEWVQRTKLTLAACFDIFSHTFSNNWINGTLYAFPYELASRYGNDNKIQSRKYCKDLIYFNDTINNFFYRSSPYNGNEFIGKDREIQDSLADGESFGNKKNLLFPTTIMDLGPKNQYIQELVNSDNFDGYIADKIPTTTYKNTEYILNIFMLSKMVNSKFIQLLIPSATFEGGNNEEGNDDPSIGAFFQNKRWANGTLFSLGSLPLPGLVDGDYAQMISISSELGVLEFNANNYMNSDLFIGVGGTGSLQDYSWFGLVFSGDNQYRDYISPRRKLWNTNATVPIPANEETMIPGVLSQRVPLYQWKNTYSDSNTIFGHQNNNYNTELASFFNIDYQKLDRVNSNSSNYFESDGAYQISNKGYIANYSITTTNNPTPPPSQIISLTPTSSAPSIQNNPLTFGAPFHFYFGLIQGSTAMDLFIKKYVDTTLVNE